MHQNIVGQNTSCEILPTLAKFLSDNDLLNQTQSG